jgi:hypothetical protein
MPVQGVTKSVAQGVNTGIKSHLFRTIAAGAEQRIITPPVSGDYMGGTSVVIPATQVIAAGNTAKISSCVITDDEGNVFSNAHDFVDWSADNESNGTVDSQGRVSKIGATDVVITAACLGVNDTCTVSVI